MSAPSIPPAPVPPPPSAPPDSSLTGIPTSRLTFRRFARLWGFALFFVVLGYLFREVLLPFVFAILIAIPIGVLAAVRADTLRDYAARMYPSAR